MFVGDGAAGASSIIHRFLNGTMLHEYTVTMLKEYKHTETFGNKKIYMRLTDLDN